MKFVLFSDSKIIDFFSENEDYVIVWGMIFEWHSLQFSYQNLQINDLFQV